MATIYIDGKSYEIDPGDNLLQVGLSLGLDIPYFCWHPALGSVGACRQCAVKQYRNEEDEKGQIVMACMTPANDGARISIEDPEVVNFRERVIEWLMVNHPHDCPVCDEGGECHLQDMTLMTGHVYRRYRFQKRTYRNQYLGPLINHEMNRCIQCYRCVRYYKEYAGGDDLDVFGAHDHVYFGRHEDGVLENEFSGNLVEICPTGVFTDKTLKRHYTRKWDLTTAPSVCVHCSVGCNTIPGERYGTIRRIRNRYNHEVNGYFLCDRGRYGYEFVNDERRVRHPLLRENGALTPVTSEIALSHWKGLVEDGASLIGIGSPRASLEANYALRELVGKDRFFAGVSAPSGRLVNSARDILRAGPARSASLNDMQQADAVFVLGEDLTNTAPMMALALRQAARNQPLERVENMQIPLWNDAAVREVIQKEHGPIYIATPSGTKLDEIATETYRAAPQDLARLGFAVAQALDAAAPAVPDLPEALGQLAEKIAADLRAAERPVVVSGTSCGDEALLQAAANVAQALSSDGRPAGIALVAPESNSLGLSLMDAADLQAAQQALNSGEANTLVILENDLYRRAPTPEIKALFAAAEHVVVIDHLMSATTEHAEMALPAATFAEGDGTLVNYEGRAQRFFQVFVPDTEIQESWRWLQELRIAAGGGEKTWRNLDDIVQAVSQSAAVFAPVDELTPPADFRIAGEKIPRDPHRYSGRTAMTANIAVSEPEPPDDPDTAMTFTMEGYKGKTPAPFLSNYWAPRWNSVQALNKFQIEVGGPLRGGDTGRRLLEPGEGVEFPTRIPDAFQPRQKEWLLVPVYHIFGSDALSMLSPGVAELAPQPYLSMNPQGASGLGVTSGGSISLAVGDITLELPVRLDESLPQGVAGFPTGLPGLATVDLPNWGKIEVKGQA